jgi:hypothetical protein
VAWPTLLSLIRFSTDYPNSAIVAFKALNGLILADKALPVRFKLLSVDFFSDGADATSVVADCTVLPSL